MYDTDAQTVLRRKLAPPRPQKVPGQDALQHMLAKTMPRDAEALLGLQVAVTGVTVAKRPKSEVISGLNPFDLVYLMKSEKGPPGLCMLSPMLLSGLIEMQMSGRVLGGDAAERRPTRTDGIVASDIVDRWISTAKAEAERLQILDRTPFADHYRAGTVADPRAADLALDPGEFRTLEISLELAGGIKSGQIAFALPVVRPGALPGNKGVAEEFCVAISETTTKLQVVLARLPSTLERAAGLSVGDILEVPISALQRVTMEGREGEPVATARLGQSAGRKAVRILGADAAAGGEAQLPGPAEFLGASLPTGAHPNSTPEVDGLPDLPDLPDLPELSDLPDLPDFPDLPDLPG
jgi:flagellar motor switch protein FliM